MTQDTLKLLIFFAGFLIHPLVAGWFGFQWGRSAERTDWIRAVAKALQKTPDDPEAIVLAIMDHGLKVAAPFWRRPKEVGK